MKYANLAPPTIRLTLLALCCLVSVDIRALTLPAYWAFSANFPCARQVLESSVVADQVTLVFSDPPQRSMCEGSLTARTADLPPGNYTLTARSAAGVLLTESPFSFTIDAAPPTVAVHALYQGASNTFFVTASQADRTALLTQDWQIADPGFLVWPATGSSPYATAPVCRFYVPAKLTHFYTASTADCKALKAAPGFVDEGIAFRALLPSGGVCGLGTKPVYRLFDPVRVNHRYTASTDTVNAMVTATANWGASGGTQPPPPWVNTWINEGIAFCSPTQ